MVLGMFRLAARRVGFEVRHDDDKGNLLSLWAFALSFVSSVV